MAIKVTTEKDGRIAIAFGRTVRRVSLGEAYSLGTKLIEAAWANLGIRLAVAKGTLLKATRTIKKARREARSHRGNPC